MSQTLGLGPEAVLQAVGAFRLLPGDTPDGERMLSHFASMSAS